MELQITDSLVQLKLGRGFAGALRQELQFCGMQSPEQE